MKLKTMTISHIRLISLYWSRFAVRSGSGLVYLLIALIFGLSMAHILIMPVEQLIIQQKRNMGKTDPQVINQTIIDIGRPIIQLIFRQKTLEEIRQETLERQAGFRDRDSESPNAAGDPKKDTGLDPWSTFLLEKRPALLSAIFILLIFGMPFVISFLGYNQVSGDIQSHGLRYLLLRTERSNIYFGRFIGTVIFSTVVIAIIVVTITFYLGMKTRIYPAGALTLWALHGFLALSILMVPYISVCSLISASVDSPFLSLVLAKVVIAGVLLMGLIGRLAWKPAKYLLYALPWGWQNNLLHFDMARCLLAAMGCLVYAGFFLFLGYYHFERRDL
ncbi:MAG: ABC transporter permease subunit [Planctomycetota bacterium]|jgi:ABC-type transport system involved in multi-copper enzyme maturation permease subunit